MISATRLYVYAFPFVFFSGDIKDLYDIKLKAGHAAAFASDCDLSSTHEMVRSIGMQVDFYGFQGKPQYTGQKMILNVEYETDDEIYFGFLSMLFSELVPQTTYMGFLDYRKQDVKDLAINPNECSFNPGVFVADIKEWKKQKITKQLEKWMEENFR